MLVRVPVFIEVDDAFYAALKHLNTDTNSTQNCRALRKAKAVRGSRRSKLRYSNDVSVGQ